MMQTASRHDAVAGGLVARQAARGWYRRGRPAAASAAAQHSGPERDTRCHAATLLRGTPLTPPAPSRGHADPQLLQQLSLRGLQPPQLEQEQAPPVVLCVPSTHEEACALLEALQAQTAALGTATGINVVAFSGGVDSSLAAFLVHSVFEDNCVAALGRSASLPDEQAVSAQQVADFIGIDLWQVPTTEGAVPAYVANDGTACFHCKTALYGALADVGGAALEAEAGGQQVALFNGTNADDLADPTRLGLLAATRHDVASPLAALPKAAVRTLAQLVGLPNWDWAASPCLRSRLEAGVPATPEALARVERAEAAVRQLLGLAPQHSLRVRVMLDGRSIVELEPPALAAAGAALPQLQAALATLDMPRVEVRQFRSGALSLGLTPPG